MTPDYIVVTWGTLMNRIAQNMPIIENNQNTLLQINHLGCHRAERALLSDFSLTVKTGEAILLQGRNGIGKTTLMYVLAGLLAPQSGDILFDGKSIYADLLTYQRNICFIGHANALEPSLTPRENLALALDYYFDRSEEAITEALDAVGLLNVDNVPVNQLSSGQQRRVTLARLQLSKAPLWLLDEPFTALDQDNIALLEQHILSHCLAGNSVIFTSHQEVNLPEELCRRIPLASSVQSESESESESVSQSQSQSESQSVGDVDYA